MKGTQDEPDSRVISPALIAVAVVFALSLAAIIMGNTVTKVFAVVIALSTLNGFWLGGARIVAVFGGMVLTALLAVPVGKLLEGAFSSAFGTSGMTNRMIAIAGAGLVLMVVFIILLQLALRPVSKRITWWRRYDRLIGSVLGAGEGVVLGLLLIWAVLTLEPLAATSVAPRGPGDGPRHNPVGERVLAWAEIARDSAVGRVADAVNPLEEMRVVTISQDCLNALNDPVARDLFINHPSIEDIRTNTAVEEALDLLAKDAQVQAIIEADRPITAEDFRVILDSEVLLTIMDDTTLVAELIPIAEKIDQALQEAMDEAARPSEPPD